MSDSVRPHRQQPTRLPCPWDSPGKNTGVGCRFLLQCMKVKSVSEVAQSCPTPSDPMDCSLPGSSIHGIFQARVLEWGAIAFSGKTNEKGLILPASIPLMFKKCIHTGRGYKIPILGLHGRLILKHGPHTFWNPTKWRLTWVYLFSQSENTSPRMMGLPVIKPPWRSISNQFYIIKMLENNSIEEYGVSPFV